MARTSGSGLHCTILTPEGRVFAGEVRSVVAPGAAGSLGILAGHMPLITSLGSGVLRVEKPDGTKQEWHVTGGFLEVLRNKVSVLAEKLEAPAKKPALGEL